MCDITTLRNWLNWGLGAILTAGAFIGAAVIANISVVAAAAAPTLMIIAGVVTLIADFFVWSAVWALNEYCQCLMGRCERQCSQLRYLLLGVAAVLLAQAWACGVAAGVAWIPGFGIPPMIAIAVTLILQLGLIIFGIGFVNALAACGQPPAAAA